MRSKPLQSRRSPRKRPRLGRQGCHSDARETRRQPSEQVNDGKCPMAVERFRQSAQVPQAPHVEGDMHQPAMDKDARQQPPPLSADRDAAHSSRPNAPSPASRDCRTSKRPAKTMPRNTATLMPKIPCVTIIELDCDRSHGAVSTRCTGRSSPRCAASCCLHHWQMFLPKLRPGSCRPH